MPKICVQSPEVVSQGEISIHAQVSIVTKAKLDEITVAGECQCEEKVKPIVEVVVLVDGSDSYNNKVNIGGKMEEGDAFEETNGFIDTHLVPGLSNALGDRCTFALVQFSGIKQLEKDYVPGSDGEGKSGLKHYNIEQKPTSIDRVRKFKGCEGLDGNGQLFLAVQDINMDGFLKQLDGVNKLAKNQRRERVLIIFSDEEWDVKNLANAFGSGKATNDSVVAVNNQNYETYACIVRPNRNADQNEDFIKNKLCNGRSSNYLKVYTDSFEVEIKRAMDKIIDNLKRL